MRATVDLDEDVAAAIAEFRARTDVGLSEAVNQIIRAGLAVPAQRTSFRQKTASLGITIDVTNVAEAIEKLEGPNWR